MQGKRDGTTTLAWQIAALSRQKKLPKLETLLGRKKRIDGLKHALRGFKTKRK
ncbi:unnamed protein product [marine sediment metagenome]|uniref:Uncharacterized protein n=1 Tax=marine sediment metagenome TaxID=412755 RepID=X0TJY6_9ZZZZ